MSGEAAKSEPGHPAGAVHPGAGPRTYLVVAAFLLAITVMEVWIFYVPALSRVLVPILLILSTLKFALVAMFYMHLKQDHRLFTGVFVFPLLIASIVHSGAPFGGPLGVITGKFSDLFYSDPRRLSAVVAMLYAPMAAIGLCALVLLGAAAAGLLIITASVAAGRSALFPRWLVVAGYVAGVIVLLGGLFFVPLALFVLWMLAVGIVMLRGSRAATAG